MEKCTNIAVTLKDGYCAVWQADQWDDCAYDGKVLIIKKDGAWVGLYNIDSIISAVVYQTGGNDNDDGR